MTFYNTNFPDDISYGSKGGPEFNTTIIRLRSGHEQRNVNWAYPLHRYDISYGVKTQAQMASVRTFFLAMLGQAHTFRFKDWHDYATGSDGVSQSPTDCEASLLVSTTISTTSNWVFEKDYTLSSTVFSRPITLPVSATVSAAINGYEVRGSSISANTATGVITLASESTLTITNISTGTPHTGVTVTGAASALFAGGGRSVYITNVSGMTEINGARYEIASVTGGRLALVLDSTLFTPYVADGTGRSHITSAEYASTAASVTVGCQFDVKCRFDSDVFDPVHTDYNITDIQLQVVEVRS